MNTIRSILILLCCLASASAYAFGAPKVEYSADIKGESEAGKVTGHVNFSPKKQRYSFDSKKQTSTMIMRKDKKVVWMLMPEQNSYLEMPMDRKMVPGDTSGYKMKVTKEGKESINGIDATKYKVVATDPDGTKFEGYMWESAEGIIVKTDLRTKEGSGSDSIMELSNLKVAPQNASLFEIPKDYTAMDIRGMLIGAGIEAGKSRHRSHIKSHEQHKNGN